MPQLQATMLPLAHHALLVTLVPHKLLKALTALTALKVPKALVAH